MVGLARWDKSWDYNFQHPKTVNLVLLLNSYQETTFADDLKNQYSHLKHIQIDNAFFMYETNILEAFLLLEEFAACGCLCYLY